MRLAFLLIIITCYNALSQSDNCLFFDGINDYVNIDIVQNEMFQNKDNFSIEFWMKGDLNQQTSSIRTCMFAINEPAGENRLLIIMGGLFAQDGYLMIYPNGSYGTGAVFVSNIVIGDNVCHHIAFTYEPGLGKVYIDGILQGIQNINSDLTPNDRYSIGQEYDNLQTSQFFHGMIDELRIWSETKTATQIQNNMNIELIGNEPNLIAYYSFNQGISSGTNTSITQLSDNSGSGYNGNITNMSMAGSSSNFVSDPCSCVISSLVNIDPCPGEVTVLNASQSGPSMWSTGETGTTINVANPGTYWVSTTSGSCLYVDTFVISANVSDPGNFLGNDLTFCQGENTTLASIAADSYLWSNGATSPSITVSDAGVYSVDITLNGCPFSDSIELFNQVIYPNAIAQYDPNCFPALIVLNDASQCSNGTLNSSSWTTPYGLQNGLNHSFYIDSPGIYTIIHSVSSIEGCSADTTFELLIGGSNSPIASFDVNPEVLYPNEIVSLTNTSLYGDTYEWIFDDGSFSTDTNVQFSYSVEGEYQISLIAFNDDGCSDTTWFTIIVRPEFAIYIPNSFTPNGDNFNNIWKYSIKGIDLYSFHMKVYNRWGEVVWESFDPENYWDGSYKGIVAPDGTYTWSLEYDSTTESGLRETLSGHVCLLR